MSGAITSLPQYAFMARCSVKARGQLYLLPCYKFMFQVTYHLGREGGCICELEIYVSPLVHREISICNT
jgi:hypothetical protein